jgi:HK97 family phage major capsid protein
MDYSTEVSEAVDGLMSAFDEFKAHQGKRLDALQTNIDKIEMRLNRPGGGFVLPGRPPGEAETKIWNNFLRYGAERMDPYEAKSLQVSTDTAGGYLAPEQFVKELLRNVILVSPIRSLARVMQISAGSALLPKRTSGFTASWVGETSPRPETSAVFGQNRYPVCELAAYVDVSNQLLDDAQFDIGAELAFEFAEEFGRAENAAFVNGNHPLQSRASCSRPSWRTRRPVAPRRSWRTASFRSITT